MAIGVNYNYLFEAFIRGKTVVCDVDASCMSDARKLVEGMTKGYSFNFFDDAAALVICRTVVMPKPTTSRVDVLNSEIKELQAKTQRGIEREKSLKMQLDIEVQENNRVGVFYVG